MVDAGLVWSPVYISALHPITVLVSFLYKKIQTMVTTTLVHVAGEDTKSALIIVVVGLSQHASVVLLNIIPFSNPRAIC